MCNSHLEKRATKYTSFVSCDCSNTQYMTHTLLLIRKMAIKCTKILHHVAKCFIKLTKHIVVIKWKSMKSKKAAIMTIIFVIVERPNRISSKCVSDDNFQEIKYVD